MDEADKESGKWPFPSFWLTSVSWAKGSPCKETEDQKRREGRAGVGKRPTNTEPRLWPLLSGVISSHMLTPEVIEVPEPGRL